MSILAKRRKSRTICLFLTASEQGLSDSHIYVLAFIFARRGVQDDLAQAGAIVVSRNRGDFHHPNEVRQVKINGQEGQRVSSAAQLALGAQQLPSFEGGCGCQKKPGDQGFARRNLEIRERSVDQRGRIGVLEVPVSQRFGWCDVCVTLSPRPG